MHAYIYTDKNVLYHQFWVLLCIWGKDKGVLLMAVCISLACRMRLNTRFIQASSSPPLSPAVQPVFLADKGCV